MQDHFSRIIIFLIVVLSILHSGEGFKCYQCIPKNPECKDKPFGEMDCTELGYTACATFTVEISSDVTAIGRTCVFPGFCEAAKQVGAVKTCHECSTELCNASTTNAVSTIIIITSGLISLLWTIQ